MEEVDHTKLKSYVLEQSSAAESWAQDISAQRTKATDYYNGKPLGNEEAGRSQVVLTEVRDTVGAILPSLMKVFFSGERAVEFIPTGPEDIDTAKQATDYINWIVNQDNNGFEVCHAAFKDALVRKVGIIKWWWDESLAITYHDFTGLDEQALAALLAEDDVELVAADQAEGLYSVTVKRLRKQSRARIAAVPPEEFLIERSARSVEDALFVEHRSEKTRSELVALGYDRDLIKSLGTGSTLFGNQERIARNPSYDQNGNVETILYKECWVYYDLDDDGIDELLKVCIAGNEILFAEPTDEIPFAAFCPDPEPHTFYGLSEADKVMDLQKIKSVVLRNMIDSLAQSVTQRIAVVENAVNMEDVLNNEVGGVIRMRAPGMVQPMVTDFVGQQAFPMLAYLDEVRENRTGMSKASMGLDADALQSSTRAAVAATISASAQRIEMIARIFAESGMTRLFTGLLRLVARHQDKQRVIRLRNQWIPVDPRSWNALMDVSVNVGLGDGSNEERLTFLNMVAQKQEAILMQHGVDNPLVDPLNLYATYAKMLELGGWKNPQEFFTDPRTWEPPPPEPDPAQMLAQLQMEDTRATMAIKQEQLKLDREKALAEQDFKRDQLDADIMMKAAELKGRYDVAVNVAEIKGQLERERADRKESELVLKQALEKKSEPKVQVGYADPPKPTTKKVIRDESGRIAEIREA